MIMQSSHFVLERREKCDVVTCRTTGACMVLLAGELEELARFLGPLYEQNQRGTSRKNCQC